ncbi:glycosyltransferase family 4 protein [Ramlibacter sp.]|uniref:glycosyltransferase family 4 protein n=1 Tax=Ramlibacter sp. TaxID=1917967 RepID=UPI002FC6F29D
MAFVNLGWGGAEIYAVWGIDALVKAGYDVTLLTLGDVDLATLNRWCGTSLRPSDIQVCRPPYGPALFPLLRGAALRAGLFQRFCRRVAGQFDLLISGYNPCDFGRPAVHLMQDFAWNEELREELDPAPREGSRRIHRPGRLRTAYLRLAAWLSKPSGRNLLEGRDLFLTNSQWLANVFERRFGLTWQRVVYPPVVFNSQPLPHSQRDDGFVILGRVDHEKRIEQAIEIIGRVRELGHDVRLHIVGAIDESTPYGAKITAQVRALAGWVVPEGRRVGVEKERILVRHRYAIHARPGEAFGIGVAELVKAGCIPFVPACGGPAEIVGLPELCWSTIDEAVRRIDRVLRDPQLQASLRRQLAQRGGCFGVDTFHREFLAQIEHFVECRAAAASP